MSYIDDFNENVNNNKIPYDDIPISRNVNSSKKSFKASVSGFKILVVLVSLMFVVNIVLCCTMFYYIKNGKTKTVNVYYPNINATEESAISTIASNTALKSAVNIAAGGSCSDEYSFYNYTLSKGAGVIYDVDEETKSVLGKTQFLVSQCLRDIGFEVNGEAIDEVVLVGGSTRMPQVKDMILNEYGKQPVTSVDVG